MASDIALAVYVLALVAAALSDLARYRIPNTISIVLVAAFALFAPALPLAAAGWHVAVGAAVLGVTAACFAFGIMGGGDAKLIAATALWMGWQNLPSFILLTSIFGGILGLVLIAARRLVPASAASGRWYSRLFAKGEGIPYACAISAAGLVLLPRLVPAALP